MAEKNLDRENDVQIETDENQLYVQSRPTCDMVDRQEKTVEDTEPLNTETVGNSNNTSALSSLFTVKQTKASMNIDSTANEDLNPMNNGLVNQQEKPEEDITSDTVSILVGHQEQPVDNVATLPGPKYSGTHLVETDVQSTPTCDMVDRKEKTVEDTEPSTPHQQMRGTNDFTTTTNSKVNQQEKTEEDCNEAWQVQLHVNPMKTSKGIIEYIDVSKKDFHWNKPVTFGRGENADFFINDKKASQSHVELCGQILPNGEVRFMSRNASKTNGYAYNEHTIKNNVDWTKWESGDCIKIAGLYFTVFIKPGDTNAETFTIHFDLTDDVHQIAYRGYPIPQNPTIFYPQQGSINSVILQYIAMEAVGEWKELGRALGLQDWQITTIDKDFNAILEKSYKMLITWVRCKPLDATLENLKNALKDKRVGRDDLAIKYCNP